MSEGKKNLKERLGANMTNRRPARYAIAMTIVLTIFATGLAVALSSCGGDGPILIESQLPNGYPPDYYEEPAPYYPYVEEPPAIELVLNMTTVQDAPELGLYHEIDFREYHTAHWGHDTGWLTINNPAVIWTNAPTPLHGFQVIGLYSEHVDDGVIAHATHVYYEMAILDMPLVINWFFTAGLFPNNGISFMDATGTRRYFAIHAGYGYEGASPFTLIEFTYDGYIYRWDAPEGPAYYSPDEASADSYSNPIIISGDFEITIPSLAPGEMILLGILDIVPGETYRLAASSASGRMFVGVTNTPNPSGPGIGSWRPFVSGGSSIIVTHHGQGYRYLFAGNWGQDEEAVDAHVSIGLSPD